MRVKLSDHMPTAVIRCGSLIAAVFGLDRPHPPSMPFELRFQRFPRPPVRHGDFASLRSLDRTTDTGQNTKSDEKGPHGAILIELMMGKL